MVARICATPLVIESRRMSTGACTRAHLLGWSGTGRMHFGECDAPARRFDTNGRYAARQIAEAIRLDAIFTDAPERSLLAVAGLEIDLLCGLDRPPRTENSGDVVDVNGTALVGDE